MTGTTANPATTGRAPSPGRRGAALGAGFAVLLVSLVLTVMAIESLGLIGSETSINPLVATIAVVVWASTGWVVSRVTGHRRWMVTGAVALVGAAVAGGLAAWMAGALLAGAAVGELVLLSPALWPARWFDGGPASGTR